MVRSSIACARCRRSKVKCINTGVNSVCKACHQSSRECTYPPSGATSTPKRSDFTAGIKTEAESETKKRVKKSEEHGLRNSHRIGEDPLESSILTRKVWDEVYDIFKLHFSTEMPFLHPPTFRNRMRQASFPRDSSSSTTSDSQDGRLLLLGVLALTARFHPELVAHHSQTSPSQRSDPLLASEYYATALAAAFGPTGKDLTTHSIDGIQALLMLGLYEWGQAKGLRAWVYVGIAIRLAQSMGLPYEDDPNIFAFYSRHASSQDDPRSTLANGQEVSTRENAIEKEVRRRTFWSCFIMDRMLSAGSYRPAMIHVDELRVQLPCSDDQFLFARKVHTGFLNRDWLGDDLALQTEITAINDDAVLSWYIRLVDIFGRFSKWSYAGGRRTEKLPPWDDRTEFYKLGQRLEEFRASLPSNLTFTEANLSAHLEKRNATTYTSMHTLYLLCLITLHREYLPFIPIRCTKPQGPLDKPTFPEGQFEVPDRFWEDSARKIFKAAREIVDIVRTCQDNNALPESPQIGFAVWQAAFVYVYAIHFSHMNTDGSQSQEVVPTDWRERDKQYSVITIKILGQVVPRMKMAKGYLESIQKMNQYFQSVKNNFENFRRNPKGGEGNYLVAGGGLDQYKLVEKELKEFGSLEDIDKSSHSDGSDTVDQTRSRASTNDLGPLANVNEGSMQGIEGTLISRPSNGSWAPINAASPSIEPDDRLKSNQRPPGYQYPNSYQQSPSQSSNPPSLISPSTGDSTSGINSPYGTAQGPPYLGSSQPQHISYQPIVQNTQAIMPPPSTQGGMAGWTGGDQAPYDEESYERYMIYQEAISMNAACDDLPQAFAIGTWNGIPGIVPTTNPSYRQVLWNSTPYFS